MFRPTRDRTAAGGTTAGVGHGITSPPRHRAGARRLLGRARRHRGIEDGQHYARDVTRGEDARRVRSGPAPQVRAAVRDAAPHLLGGVNRKSIAAATRHLAAKPFYPIRLARPRTEN